MYRICRYFLQKNIACMCIIEYKVSRAYKEFFLLFAWGCQCTFWDPTVSLFLISESFAYTSETTFYHRYRGHHSPKELPDSYVFESLSLLVTAIDHGSSQNFLALITSDSVIWVDNPFLAISQYLYVLRKLWINFLIF